MKVFIFSGFLGSGKTSVILQLANYLTKVKSCGKPASTVIIENEIGETGIDDKIIASQGYEVKNITAGCICCTMVSDLALCLTQVAEEINPEWIIIEATGMAYPQKIKEIVDKYLHIKPVIISVADADRWLELNEIFEPLVHGQLKGAACVLLNKTDLVDEKVLTAVKESVSNFDSNIKIFEVCALREIDKSIWEALLNV